MVRELRQLNTVQQRLIVGLCMLCLMFAIAYVYAVHRTVYNVVTRSEQEERIDELRTTVARLEFQYIKEKNAITRTYAEGLGYREPTNLSFVSRNSAGDVALRFEQVANE